jgi:hypothetical protein
MLSSLTNPKAGDTVVSISATSECRRLIDEICCPLIVIEYDPLYFTATLKHEKTGTIFLDHIRKYAYYADWCAHKYR